MLCASESVSEPPILCCTAVCCSVLQCDAACGSGLQCNTSVSELSNPRRTAVCCSVLHSELQRVAVCCSMLYQSPNAPSLVAPQGVAVCCGDVKRVVMCFIVV